jgi:hypothetical protein
LRQVAGGKPLQKAILHLGDKIEFTADEALQHNIENVLDGMEWTVKHLFLELPDVNKRTAVDFLNTLITTENSRPNTKRAYVTNLVLLSRYYKHKKSFRDSQGLKY